MKNAKPDVPAVVLSGNLGRSTGKGSLNEAALALTRSLGRKGVPVSRFHPDRSLFDLSSRYATHIPCPNLYDDPIGLVSALVDFAIAAGTRPVLFPASDGAARFIADHEASLADHFALTSPGAACINRTQQKHTLIETAESFGIPVPKTFFPTDPAALPAIAAQISYPLIVKPVYSPDWKRPEVTALFGQVKALTLTSPRELIENCAALLTLQSTIMLQEIVPGTDEDLITFIGYVGRDGQVLAGCVRKKLRQFPPGFGYCSMTESVDDPEIMALSIKLLQSLNYRGIGCIEFKRDPRDATPKLIEINARAVRTSMLAIAAGVDFPWVAYQDSVGASSVELQLNARVPTRWVHLRDEVWAAGQLILRGELSLFGWIRGFIGKPIVLAEFSWDDPRPGLLSWAQVPVQIARRVLGGRSGTAVRSPPVAGSIGK